MADLIVTAIYNVLDTKKISPCILDAHIQDNMLLISYKSFLTDINKDFNTLVIHTIKDQVEEKFRLKFTGYTAYTDDKLLMTFEIKDIAMFITFCRMVAGNNIDKRTDMPFIQFVSKLPENPDKDTFYCVVN